MPNQRAKNKAFIGVFVEGRLKHALEDIARSEDIPLTTLISQILTEHIRQREIDHRSVEDGSRASEADVKEELAPDRLPPSVLSDEELWML